MWPWEHLVLGYLLYSLSVHALLRRPPGERATLTLVIATQFPDFVDKPLGWLLGVVPGHSVAHSVFIAAPLILSGMILAGRYDRPGVGAAWAIGYLSHLLGDVFSPTAIIEMDVSLGFLFWPLVPVPMNTHGGFVQTLLFYVQESLAYLLSPLGIIYLIAEVGILSAAFAIWMYDGHPGAGLISEYLSHGRLAVRRRTKDQ